MFHPPRVEPRVSLLVARWHGNPSPPEPISTAESLGTTHLATPISTEKGTLLAVTLQHLATPGNPPANREQHAAHAEAGLGVHAAHPAVLRLLASAPCLPAAGGADEPGAVARRRGILKVPRDGR